MNPNETHDTFYTQASSPVRKDVNVGPYDDVQSYEDETPQIDKKEYANSMMAMFDQP